LLLHLLVQLKPLPSVLGELLVMVVVPPMGQQGVWVEPPLSALSYPPMVEEVVQVERLALAQGEVEGELQVLEEPLQRDYPVMRGQPLLLMHWLGVEHQVG
jgi:hypothetical protein